MRSTPGRAPLRAIARTRRALVGIVDWFERREFSENTVLLAFAVVTGVLAATGVIVFYRAIDASYEIFYRWPGKFLPAI